MAGAKTKAVNKVTSIKPGKKNTPIKAAAQSRDPFSEIDRLLEGYFPRGWMRPFRVEWPDMPRVFEGKAPHVDVIDHKSEVIVKAAMPGVEKKDIDVTVTKNSVTIKGTTSHEKKEEKEDYYHSEISRGSYCRSMLLPAEVDESKARAKFKDGILELSLPKCKEEKEKSRRTIKVE